MSLDDPAGYQPLGQPLMAAGNPPPPYFVQNAYANPQHFPHHSSVSAFWKTKWRNPCSKSIYPFMDGKLEDFDPIFEQLIRTSNDDIKIMYDPDAYAAPFFPVAEKLVKDAEKAEQAGDINTARELFLRAAAVYRISRFPIIRSEMGAKAWEANKDAYLRGSKYLDPPNQEVRIPFPHAAKGDKKTDIMAYLRIPKGSRPSTGWPVLLFMCGIDAYRTDHTNRTDAHTSAGFATLSIEIAGSGDCPADCSDPEGIDRMWSSVLDWIGSSGRDQFGFDPTRIVARGISTGGYNGFRIAHTHADRLLAVVAQGGFSHHALNPDWIRAMNHMEYPYALGEAFACKHGYASIEDMCTATPSAQNKFSLVETGILDKPSCRLLVINGMLDSLFPIEDSILVATRGRVKDVRFMEGKYHMGNPGAEGVLLDWIDEVLREGNQGVRAFNA